MHKDTESLHHLADAVEHAVMRDLIKVHQEAGMVAEQPAGIHPAPSTLVLILKDSDGHWDSVPL